MARRKKGNVVNGWLVLDKPAGMSSTEAVAAVRRCFDAQKAGHAGTLDPLATGILPIALGEATKTVPFAVDGEKAYRFTVRWGAETTTDDREGEVVRTSPDRPSREAIQSLLSRFVGEVLQTPPQFSAIKIDGERAYDLARSGETVAIEPRLVEIFALEIVDMPDADTTVFETECGRGTYVRAIARDLGRLLGCYGHVIDLRRTRVAGFDEDRAVSLDELRHAAYGEAGPPQRPADGSPWPRPTIDLAAAETLLEPVEAVLDDITELQISTVDAGRLMQGKAVLVRGRDAPVAAGTAYAMCKGRLIALGALEQGEFRPSRIFNLR
jgi:tRNA pseudouridine55 synthase